MLQGQAEVTRHTDKKVLKLTVHASLIINQSDDDDDDVLVALLLTGIQQLRRVMLLFFLVVILLQTGSSHCGLPFYNGFYYDHVMDDKGNGKNNGEGRYKQDKSCPGLGEEQGEPVQRWRAGTCPIGA